MTVDLDALRCAHRLETLGIVVRSPELNDQAKRLVEFKVAGGNRAARASRRAGAGRTPRVGGAKVR